MLDYLPRDTIFLICDPENVTTNADLYAQQVPDGDAFYISWEEFQEQLASKEMTSLEVAENFENVIAAFRRGGDDCSAAIVNRQSQITATRVGN